MFYNISKSNKKIIFFFWGGGGGGERGARVSEVLLLRIQI